MAGLPIEETMAVASVAGSGAAAIANRSADSILRKVCEGIIGAAVGVFCGPALADSLGVQGEHLRMAIGFGTGAVGAIALTLFLDWAKSTDVGAWLKNLVARQVKP